MGQNVADTHVGLHGEGPTHHTPTVRLHWGAKGIDETHPAPSAAVLAWASAYLASDWASLQSLVYQWMQAAGVSPAAWAERAAFAAAMRRAWGTA